MLTQLLDEFSSNNGSNISLILSKAGTLQSLDPPETLFGFSCHGHCIPPFKPEHTLILGYGSGQIAELIRKIWGSVCKITGVDIAKMDYKYNEYQIKIMDAYNFVKECADSIFKTRFDYIVLDIFDTEKNAAPDFIFEPSFVIRLREICKKLLCTNVFTSDVKNMWAYYDYGLKFVRHDNVYGNSVIFWSIEK